MTLHDSGRTYIRLGKKHEVTTNGCLSQKGSGGGSLAAAMATSVSCEACGGESLMAC